MNKDNSKNNEKDYYVIDILHIIKSVWHRAWIVVLSGFLAGCLGFAYSAFLIKPQYSASVMLYVNNSSFSVGNTNFSISSSEIVAAQSLLKTYTVILNNRTTLEAVIEKSGVEDITFKDLSKMIEATSVNETEVLKVEVTCENPEEAAVLANSIAEVLPVRISEVIEGSSMKIVDSAIVNRQKVSPSITKYSLVGAILGGLIAVIVLVIVAMMDDTIHSDEYIIENYNYPILAKVPDLTGQKQSRGYYSYYKRHGYKDYSSDNNKKDGE